MVRRLALALDLVLVLDLVMIGEDWVRWITTVGDNCKVGQREKGQLFKDG